MSKSTTPYKSIRTRVNPSTVPQSAPLPGEAQSKNSAGGFVYTLDPWKHFERFLILGSEGGTYYVSEQKLTKENAATVARCIAEDGRRAVDLIVNVSDTGRAAKNDPALFALAMAAAAEQTDTRQYALAHLPKVARIPTHLYHFLTFVEQFRGWGRGLRTAVSGWVNSMDADKLAFEFVKYQSRDGWSNRDVLRKAHPVARTGGHDAVLRWAVGGLAAANDIRTVTRKSQNRPVSYNTVYRGTDTSMLPTIIEVFESVKHETDANKIVKAITDHGLTREMIPTEHLKSAKVWEALLERMPLEAMIRNLRNMTKAGLLTSTSDATKTVAARLGDMERLRKARIHPLSVLNALMAYKEGRTPLKGGYGMTRPVKDTTATPIRQIVDALDAAFYTAFGNVTPTGKAMVLALDVSGSMEAQMGGTLLTCREATAALALVTAAVEQTYTVLAFSASATPGYIYHSAREANPIVELSISPRQRLDDVIKTISGLPFGGTDCALPMQWAMKQKKAAYDAFLVYTDNETWAGSIHPSQALRNYRKEYTPGAKLVVVGMTATEFTIADPKDPGMLDVVGFDLSTPHLISEFVRE